MKAGNLLSGPGSLGISHLQLEVYGSLVMPLREAALLALCEQVAGACFKLPLGPWTTLPKVLVSVVKASLCVFFVS